MASYEKLPHLQALLEEILDIQRENAKDIDSIQRVEEILLTSHRLVEDSHTPSEMVIDARVLQTATQVVSANITALDTNLATFNEEEYKAGILSYLMNKRLVDSGEEKKEGEDDEDENADADEEMDEKENPEMEEEEVYEGEEADSDVEEEVRPKPWHIFGSVTYQLYHKSDAPVFLAGTLSFNPPVVKEKLRAVRTKRVSGVKTTLSQLSEGPQVGEKKADNIYDHIFNTLEAYYKSNDLKPLNFLAFVINPDNYWDSVQNIFHLSFLAKEGRVNIYLDADGLPVIVPLLKNSRKRERKEINHFCFSLSMSQWTDCIQKFNITSPMIKPMN